MFCKNCGNTLEENDKICAVCGESAEAESTPPSEEGGEDNNIKTPLFDFKWDVQDFPNEEAEKTEDIDFKWEPPKEDSLADIGATPTFADEPEEDEEILTEDSLFKVSKKNEEFQELLDKEFEKYSTNKAIPQSKEVTRRYDVSQFKENLEEPVEPITETTEPVIETVSRETEPQSTESVAGINIFDSAFVSPVDSPREEAPEENTQEETKAPSGPNFIDTSFVSPFGGADDVQNEIKSSSEPIEEDEFLKELPFGDDTNTQEELNITDAPDEQVAEEKPEEAAKKNKIVGPEIVDQPVIFPFDLGEEDSQKASIKEEAKDPQPAEQKETKEPEATEQKEPDNTSSKEESASEPATPREKAVAKAYEEMEQEDKHRSGVDGFTKFLIVLLVIVLILVAGVAVMKIAPNSGIGIILNNSYEKIMGNIGNVNGDTDENVKFVEPYSDFNALIESQMGENKNIKSVTYDPALSFDSGVNYSISGANSSKPLENNFWHTNSIGDVLLDEQAVGTVIGYNSSWVDYLNNGNEEVFNYVVSGSEADKSLNKDKLEKGSKVIYNDLRIGEIRQNGNRFYVWTKEDITIKNKKGKKKNAVIQQLYELETSSDTLKVTKYVTL